VRIRILNESWFFVNLLKEVQRECRIEKAERCIKRSVLIVAKNVKFHSNPILAGQFTAEIVGQREDNREDVDIRP